MELTYHGRYSFQHEPRAQLDLLLALLAFESVDLDRFFPAEQAVRIYDLIYKLVNSPEYGDYAASELALYHQVFRDWVERGDAVHAYRAIAARLLEQWLNQQPGLREKMSVEILGKHFPDPILVTWCMGCLTYSSGRWKKLLENYTVLSPPDSQPM